MGDDSIGSPLETFSDESNPVLIATQPRLIRPEALRVPHPAVALRTSRTCVRFEQEGFL
jgi:hypothetical protein